MVVDGEDFVKAVMYLQVLYIASLTERTAASLSTWTQCPKDLEQQKFLTSELD
jgi:hypothetical protein